MFVYRFKVGGAFSGDDYENEETADNIFQARNSYKKQHGSSNYNNSSSYSYSSSNQNADNRKNDKSIFFNELNCEMVGIASRYSRYITYNSDYIDVHVYAHVYISEIVF